jgi:hypothetical protein
MLVAAQRDDHSQHRQPQKQKIRELVGPHQRTAEDVARSNAGKKNPGFGQYQRGAGSLAQSTDRAIDLAGEAAQSDPGCPLRGDERLGQSRSAAGHARLPTDFSSNAQALSPDLLFISL